MSERKPTAGNKIAPVATVLTPKDVLGILCRHVLLIVIMTLLGLGAGGGIWKLLQKYLPKYTAETYIQVLPPVETDPMNIVATQVNKDIHYQHRLSMANLIRQQKTLQDLLRNDKVRATKWFQLRGKDDRKAFKYLKEYLGAYAHKDAEFVEISMTCEVPEEAALLVNEMAQLFVSSQGGSKKADISEKLRQYEERRDRVQSELTAAEAALDDVRKVSGITDLEQPAGRYWRHTFEVKLDDLELQESELLLTIKQTEADLENLKKLAEGPVSVQIEQVVENDPVMVMLAEQLAFQEAHLAGKLTKFGENHREMRQTRQLIDEIKEKRQNRQSVIAEQTRQAGLANAQDKLIVLQRRLAELQNLREEAAAKKKDLDLARVQYEQRLAIRDERLKSLDEIKQQIEKWRLILNDPETTKVQLLGLAPPPLEMVTSRQWWLWFPSGTMMGLLLGIGLAFLAELANDLVRTPRDVARFLNIPLLGMIPDEAEDELGRDVDLALTVHQAPSSLISECYRQLRTNFELSGAANSWKTVLITSGDAGDGKTSVATNMALALVAKNAKVLLIDANFRRPSLRKIFPYAPGSDTEEKPSNLGLSNLLMGRCGYEVIRPSGIEALDVIDSGAMPSNPADLLAGPRMRELVSEQRKIYDYIIIDSPPLLLVSDAKVLAKVVDATILVLNAAATSRGAAARAVYELRAINANVIGCVLFAVKAMRGGYFHEQFKSYRKYQKKLKLAGANSA